VHIAHRGNAFEIYSDARAALINDPDKLIRLEEYLAEATSRLTLGVMDEAEADYNAASVLYPFWEAYPPEERGNHPRGDQYPWIEVGEHAIGVKLARAMERDFVVGDLGFPTGADQRFIVSGPGIKAATGGLTDTAWLCIDIKSVGPRDDFDHAVMSHNQISGSGEWAAPDQPVRNQPMLAVGARASHPFYPAIPPLLVLPDGRVAPTITMALKPVYSMLPQDEKYGWTGQPLDRVHLVTIPNGLLLTQNPNYLKQYPGLLYPGKDDKKKAPTKLRSRVSFTLLVRIATWRWRQVWQAGA